MVFPTQNGLWTLSDKQQQLYVAAYPELDVPVELERASLWLEHNRHRRKTKAGMSRFVVGWLNRSVIHYASTGRSKASLRDWAEECQRLHAGACHERWRHDQRKQMEAFRARHST